MRLIDADKLIKTIEEQPYVDFDEINNKRTEFCDYVYDLFSDEPTNEKANAVICLYDEIISAFERV